MNYNSYNISCLITSIIMFLILIFKFNQINLCILLLLSAIFSILWRSIKIIKGKEVIEKNNNHHHSLVNPFFILDFSFAILAFLCIIFSKQINKKLIVLLAIIFIMAWYLTLSYTKKKNKNIKTSQAVHFYGHCYVILIIFLTFYLNIF